VSGHATSAGRLPRGRHGLSRDQVARAQRERIMAGLVAAVGERGYAAATVADVLSRAGVSRESFYQHYSSKLDCFVQTFDHAASLLVGELRTVVTVPESAPRATKLEAALHAYLDLLVVDPSLARLFLVESMAAGPALIERRAAVQDRLVDELVELLGLSTEEERFGARALVAAVGSLVTVPLVAGDVGAVVALREPVVGLARRLLC
jgi:AcrR family transcriptional regulator